MSKAKIRDTFMDIDDVLGQLSDAVDVLEYLTTDTIANKALNPVMIQLQEMQRLVKDIWPVAVKPVM